MRYLRRFGLIGEEQRIVINKAKLRERQTQQLSLLQPLKKDVQPSFLNLTIQQLLKINSQRVFNTFATRCLLPQINSLNAMADVNIERVFQKQAHKKIPFSVKDHLKVEGMIETCGFADNLKPSTFSSQVVQILQNEGCIAFAHSNVPQGLLGIQSNNPLWGSCRNPHNPNFLSGGSSGGEGAMVASKASVFGIGSDSGGSARLPAAFCGVYGFKPTGSKRLSIKGRVGPSGVQGIKIGDLDPSFGFITRSVNDLAWLCSKTIGKRLYPEQGYSYGGEWDESRYQAARRKKLTIGYLYQNQEMKVAPGIVNSIQQTLELLRSQKHKVVQFKFPQLHQFRNFFFQFIHQSGFLNVLSQRMNGHAVASQAKNFYDIGLFGSYGAQYKVKHAEDAYIKQIYKLFTKDQTTWQFFRIHKEVSQLKKKFIKQWKEAGLDILITPVAPFTAILPGTSDLLVFQLTFCAFQNILELPAGVIPTRLVNQNETTYAPKNAYEQKAAQSIKKSKGLPIAIQITGNHLADQQCLGAMCQINKLVGNYLQPNLASKAT